MIRSAPDMAYHDGSVCQATGPDGVPRIGALIGRWAAFMAFACVTGRSWAKVGRKNGGAV